MSNTYLYGRAGTFRSSMVFRNNSSDKTSDKKTRETRVKKAICSGAVVRTR